MNVFALSECPLEAASFHYVSHKTKMCLESLQMLCTNTRIILNDELVSNPYMMRSTHVNHPSTLWARSSAYNMAWLVAHCEALFKEFRKQSGKEHASEKRLHALMPLFEQAIMTLEEQGKFDLTPFALAMPDECKQDDAIASYRNYYEYKAREEIAKIQQYHALCKLGLDTRKPVLYFVWKEQRPAWANFETADEYL